MTGWACSPGIERRGEGGEKCDPCSTCNCGRQCSAQTLQLLLHPLCKLPLHPSTHLLSALHHLSALQDNPVVIDSSDEDGGAAPVPSPARLPLFADLLGLGGLASSDAERFKVRGRRGRTVGAG